MEIVTLQLCYYFTLTLLIIAVDDLMGHRMHIGQLFDPRAFELSHKYGYTNLIVHVLNIPFVVAAEAFIVEKANKCLDFTVTIFILHVIAVCCWFGHFPLNFRFYLINGIIIVVTVLAAECFCMRLE